MALWKIQRANVSTNEWIDTGEIYDDSRSYSKDEDGNPLPALSVEDFVAKRKAEDGWDYRAIPR